MTNPDKSEGQRPTRDRIHLPTEVTEYDLHRIEVLLRERSLGASVSQVMVDEADKLRGEELERWLNAGGIIDLLDNDTSISWDGYLRPARAYLNVEELLRGRLPYEDPEQALRTPFDDMEVMNDILGIDREVANAQRSADWHIRLQGDLTLLVQTKSPLELVDAVVTRDIANSSSLMVPDKYFRELKSGQLRFHQLYNAGQPLFQLKQTGK